MKETKKTNNEIDEDFTTEEDKRVIVFVAIALLVIIGTIIGLLVGCQKEEKSDDETNKDYVIPVEKDIEEEEETTESETRVVKKVTTVEKEETNDLSYEIVFYYDNNNSIHTVKVNNEEKVSPYLPTGYSSCKYYTDDSYTNEFDFSSGITNSQNIYMSCEAKVYNIVYSDETTNPIEYKVTDGNIDLYDLETELIFEGWYTSLDYTNKVTKLSKDILDYEVNGTIYLYAKIVESYTINYYDNGEIIKTVELNKEELNNYNVYDGSSLGNEENKFLGWSIKENSMSIEYSSNDNIKVTGNMNLYTVFGSSVIAYVDDGEVIEKVGITKEESEEYNLPTKENLGLEAPTYFVPVDNEDENTKTVVSDETVDLKDNDVKLSEVVEKSYPSYTPQVGDKVEELEKELTWTIDETIIDTETGEEVTNTITDQEIVEEKVKENIGNGTDSELEAEWIIPEPLVPTL